MQDGEKIKQLQVVSKMIEEHIQNERKLIGDITLFLGTIETTVLDADIRKQQEVLNRSCLNVEEMLSFIKRYSEDLVAYSDMVQMDVNAARLDGFASTGNVHLSKTLI